MCGRLVPADWACQGSCRHNASARQELADRGYRRQHPAADDKTYTRSIEQTVTSSSTFCLNHSCWVKGEIFIPLSILGPGRRWSVLLLFEFHPLLQFLFPFHQHHKPSTTQPPRRHPPHTGHLRAPTTIYSHWSSARHPIYTVTKRVASRPSRPRLQRAPGLRVGSQPLHQRHGRRNDDRRRAGRCACCRGK